MGFEADVSLVHKAEETLGCTFPPGYVVRVCRDNGGAVEAAGDVWQLHPIFDDSSRKRLKRTCNDVTRETASAAEWSRFPTGAVAVAANGTGDRLVLVRDESDPSRLQHRVFVWNHETGDLEVVADGFEDLEDTV